MMEFAVFTHAEKEIMANASKLIFGAAIAAVSIATPALAAHKGNPISTHHNGYAQTPVCVVSSRDGRASNFIC
jgi:hypothetical protein